MRIFLTIIVPFLIPTLLYVLWQLAVRRAPLGPGGLWLAMPWPWLALVGLALAALLLYGINVRVGSAPQGTYVAPQLIDGRIVPGHVVPTDPARR
jgi:hypothetical protein